MPYKNIEDYKTYQKNYRLNNKEILARKDKKRKKLYRLNNIELIKEISRKYYLKNKEHYKKYGKEYYLKNSHFAKARFAKRKAAKLRATPKFADLNKIREIYKNCPNGYHVDHIIPLQGKNVCGLHVEWNLQYLTPSANLSKSNRLIY
jgi:5-methylcytosine-specific restriction endonuclease McrA